jgi:hypothetical protein
LSSAWRGRIRYGDTDGVEADLSDRHPWRIAAGVVAAECLSDHRRLRDYRPLHADAITPGGPGHFGMIFMPGTYRRTKQDTGPIIAALEAKLTEYPGDEDLANGECWL